MKNVALVGVGAHAKRIYMNFFKKHKINLALVVELASQKDITKRYLEENGFNTTEIFIIDDSLKDNNYLPIEIFNKLKLKCD